MALGSGALKKDFGTTVNHILGAAAGVNDGADSSGEAIDNAFTNADEYSFCDVVIACTFASAPNASNDGLTLKMRSLDVQSTSDEGAWITVGAKEVDGVATEQYLRFSGANGLGIPIWKEGAEFMFENNAGQNINTGWDLDILPWTWNTQA